MKIKTFLPLLFLLSASTAVSYVCLAHPGEGMRNTSFEEATFEFLNSVRVRDYQKFLSYISENEPITAILPDGRIINNAEEFIQSQTKWFQSTSGGFDFKLQSLFVEQDFGFASILVDFRFKDSQEIPFKMDIYISLIFRKNNEKWYLIHDQNTLIQKISPFLTK